MRDLRQRFPNDLAVIGVHSAKFPSERLTANIHEAVERLDIEHPVVNDAGFQVWRAYGVNAWPTIVLIDPLGNYVGSQAGEIQAAEFAPLIEAMIADFGGQGQISHGVLDLVPAKAAASLETAVVATTGQRARLHYPSKVLSTADGRLFVADTGHHRVVELRLSGSGSMAALAHVYGSGEAGLEDGPADTARFREPRGMALHGSTLYVADTGNHAIRAIDLDRGLVRTVAGTGAKGGWQSSAGSGPLEMALRSPWDLAYQGDTLFIAMAGAHQVWALTGETDLRVFAGNGREALVDGTPSGASFNQPSGLALGEGVLYVADAEASAVRAIAQRDGMATQVTTLIGTGLFDFGDVDGAGGRVRLQHDQGLACGAGSIFIADTYNHKIKRLDPQTRRVETLIGTGLSGDADGPFADAQLFEPEGVAVQEAAGTVSMLYIADTNNHLIRAADLVTGAVRTVEIEAQQETASAAPAAGPAERVELPPVDVGPGFVTLTFDVILPEGYKFNADLPPNTIQVLDGTDTIRSFLPGEPPSVGTDVASDELFEAELTLYYCWSGEAEVCLIDDRRLAIPLRVRPGAPRQVAISYRVQPRER